MPKNITIVICALVIVIGAVVWYTQSHRPVVLPATCDSTPPSIDPRGLVCQSLASGWYYASSDDTCHYFSSSASCWQPPFSTGKDCQQACHAKRFEPGQSPLRTD